MLRWAAIPAVALSVTAIPTPDPRASIPPFEYGYADTRVQLEPSPDYAAVFPEDPQLLLVPQGWSLDELGERPDFLGLGMRLLRAQPETEQTWEDLMEVLATQQVAVQPVFEQGPVLKIASDEILVQLNRPMPVKAVAELFGPLLGDLGLADVAPVRGLWLALRLKQGCTGCAFLACTILAGHEEVAAAEPNFINVYRGPVEDPAAFLPPPSAPIFFQFPHALDAPPSWRMLPTWERRPPHPDWDVLLDGHFEGDVTAWSVAYAADAAAVEPAVTTRRAHTGERAVYMSGANLGGQPAPGPYPPGAHAYLVSPAVALEPLLDAFVELWFWAEFEERADRREPYPDYARLLILEEQTRAVAGSVPLIPAPIEGDPTVGEAAAGGWRRVLARLPRSVAAGLRVIVEFVSDGSQAAEGIYVDDVRVLRLRPPVPLRSGPSEDPRSASQWELEPRGQIAGRPGSDATTSSAPAAAAAWKSRLPAPGLRVALVDDGVEQHADLAFAEPDGTEDAFPEGTPSGPEGHGTACAGVIGARRGNAVAGAGVAPGVALLPLRRGPTDAHLAAAIDAAVKHRARVIVVPWGWIGAPSMLVTEALDTAVAKGIVVVAAAGDGWTGARSTTQVQFPCFLSARIPQICVGAASPAGEPKSTVSADGQHWWRSTFDAVAPDVFAPGTWLHTSDRVGALGYNAANDAAADWADNFSGSGSAACYVAGVAALLLSEDEEMTPAQMKQVIARTARPVPLSGSAKAKLIMPKAAIEAAAELAARRRAERRK